MPAASDLVLQRTHEALGAVFAERRGRPRIASYGDPSGEYAAAREKAALADLAERGVLEASGPSRQKLLQGILSNDVAGRGPGQGCLAALTSAKGAVQALLRVLVEKDVVVLETDADRIELVRGTLEHYRVAAPVRFAVRPTSVLAVLGPGADAVLRAVGAASPAAGDEDHVGAKVAGATVRIARAHDLPAGGFVVHASPEAVPAVWAALGEAGARPVGRDALDALRVEAVRPWYGDDVTEENLLHETGLVPEYHSPTKGCYLGQEVIARLEARGGHVNKALRGLRLTAPATPDAAVTAGGSDVGRVTTPAVSPRLGPLALAYVRRGHFDPGTAVFVEGAPATVVTTFEEPSAPAERS